MYLFEEDGKYYVQKAWNSEEEPTVISKEVYETCTRSDWREQSRKHRESTCRHKGTSRCTKDCNHCDRYDNEHIGRTCSLEMMAENRKLPLHVMPPPFARKAAYAGRIIR